MIFVCGCPHSGTSLVAAMLGAHSAVFTIPIETYVFARNDSDPVRVRAFFEHYEAEAQGARYLCEKTPGHTQHFDAIYSIFPEARVIAVVRDPRGVAASMRGRIGRLDAGWQRWNAANRRVRKLLASERAAHLVHYESLIGDPAATLAELCTFLGLGYEPAMLEYHRDDREWFKAKGRRDNQGAGEKDQREYRNWQIHQPLMDKRFEWRRLLTPEEIAQVEAECAPVMRHFGYEPEAMPA